MKRSDLVVVGLVAAFAFGGMLCLEGTKMVLPVVSGGDIAVGSCTGTDCYPDNYCIKAGLVCTTQFCSAGVSAISASGPCGCATTRYEEPCNAQYGAATTGEVGGYSVQNTPCSASYQYCNCSSNWLLICSHITPYSSTGCGTRKTAVTVCGFLCVAQNSPWSA